MSLDTFLKDFEIINTFKETGQKRVFSAQHSDYGKVILKIGKSPSKSRLDRARREVDVQSSLNSPNYPRNFNFITFDEFQFVIIEEFVESQPLSACRERFSDPLSILRLLESLVDSLDLLWQARITHRDLKPDNILIKPDDSPVIIDLGICLAIERTDLTPPHATFSPCTPNYAAPEQLKNRRAEIDYRTDQFILGIDVMELLGGGIHPFDPVHLGYGDSIPQNIINRNWNKEMLDRGEFLPIKNLINRLLAPEPYLRFRNTGTLKAEIRKGIEVYQ